MQVAVGGQESAAGALAQAVGERERKREDWRGRRGWRPWKSSVVLSFKTQDNEFDLSVTNYRAELFRELLLSVLCNK